jgi:hypothetical protein
MILMAKYNIKFHYGLNGVEKLNYSELFSYKICNSAFLMS